MDCVVTRAPRRLDWLTDWSGETAIIVASGPSASFAETLGALRGADGKARCIAINESYRLAPWADVLYGADYFWWLKHNGLPAFPGLRVSAAEEAADAFPGLRHVELEGDNSGAQALNLAVLFGARRIILVGYDMTLDHGVHWHGLHRGGSQNPDRATVAAWRDALDGAAGRYADAGVEVLNASPLSALTAYRRVRLEDVL